jgi:hypothetical protein
LDTITDLVRRMPTGTAEQLRQLLAFERAAAAALPEQSVTLDARTVREIWGDELTAELLERFTELGHVRLHDGGRVEFLSPRMYQGAAELERLGVPVAVVFELTSALFRHMDALAADIAPLLIENMPKDASFQAGATAARMSRIAEDVIAAAFGIAMRRVIERVVPGVDEHL